MGTVRKRFNLNVQAENELVSAKFEIEKTAKKIVGIVLTSNREDLLFYRGAQRIEINGVEIFPEDYESKLLMISLNVPPNVRYYSLRSMEVGTGIIKVAYKDTAHPRMAFKPYRVSIYVEYEV